MNDQELDHHMNMANQIGAHCAPGESAVVTAARAALGEEPKKTAISGPEFFGYSLPHIRLLVEELPGVARCGEYQHLMQRQTKPAEESGEGDAMEVDAS